MFSRDQITWPIYVTVPPSRLTQRHQALTTIFIAATRLQKIATKF